MVPCNPRIRILSKEFWPESYQPKVLHCAANHGIIYLIAPWPFMFWTPPLPETSLLGCRLKLREIRWSWSGAQTFSPTRGLWALSEQLTPPPVSSRLEGVDVHRVVDPPIRPHRALGCQQLHVGQRALARESPRAQEFTRVYAPKVPNGFVWSKLTEVVQFYNVITIRCFYASPVEVRMRN